MWDDGGAVAMCGAIVCSLSSGETQNGNPHNIQVRRKKFLLSYKKEQN